MSYSIINIIILCWGGGQWYDGPQGSILGLLLFDLLFELHTWLNGSIFLGKTFWRRYKHFNTVNNKHEALNELGSSELNHL